MHGWYKSSKEIIHPTRDSLLPATQFRLPKTAPATPTNDPKACLFSSLFLHLLLLVTVTSMSCSPAKCGSCSKPCNGNDIGQGGDALRTTSADPEDVKAQLEAALLRAQAAEQAYENLKAEQKVERAVKHGNGMLGELKPLRSQAWFNNRKSWL